MDEYPKTMAPPSPLELKRDDAGEKTDADTLTPSAHPRIHQCQLCMSNGH